MSQTKKSTAFAGLGLNNSIVSSLTTLGYEEPTPIQTQAIPPLLEGQDLLGQAATGTGKTAAFALPMLQQICDAGSATRGTLSALILTPTRELAIQVAEAIHKYSYGLDITVLPIYGGADMRQQLKAISRGVDIVVATPGRAVDHIRRRSLALDTVRLVVLDEADEMLDMGFAEDLEAILSKTPDDRQTALFSATMAPRIAAIANKHLKNPVKISIERETVKPGSAPRVKQVAYIIPRSQKIAALGRILDVESPTSAIVFCRTRTEVDTLTETLGARGYRAEALHGGMSQEQRDRVMKKFRANKVDLLIATDVAARGLDVEHLSHVVNYDVPTSTEAYVHRIGRTGRAGREGVAITLAEPREHHILRNVERVTKQKVEIATIPTVSDLKARKIELTREAVRERLEGEGLNSYRGIVNALIGAEFDVMDVAAAAIQAVHEMMGNTNEGESEIDFGSHDSKPAEKTRRSRADKRARSGGEERGPSQRSGRFEKRPDRGDRSERGGRSDRSARPGRPERGERSERKSYDSKKTDAKPDRFKKKDKFKKDEKPAKLDRFAKFKKKRGKK